MNSYVDIAPLATTLSQRSDLLQFIMDTVLGRRIKQDYATKISCFCAGLSAYGPDPINLFLKEVSSSGKTYNAVNSLIPFPQHDVWGLGGLSPTALTHLYGILIDEQGQEINLDDAPNENRLHELEEIEGKKGEAKTLYKQERKAWREKIQKSRTLIDLSNKILLFLEAPHKRTYDMLYPILSHDKHEIEYKITEKTGKGQLRTSHIIIRGWPATIFCTAKEFYLEELATRCFTVSPKTDADKFQSAIELTGTKAAAPWLLDEWNQQDHVVRLFIQRLHDYAKTLHGIINPFGPYLAELYPKEYPRDMRDFSHFISLINTLTLLHYAQRPIAIKDDHQYLMSTASDIENARRIFFLIFEATRSHLSERKLVFFHQIIATQEQWSTKELTDAYNHTFPDTKSSKTIQRYVNELLEAGYVNVYPDPSDKRRNLYEPIKEKGTIPDIFEMSLISDGNLENMLKNWFIQYGQQCEYHLSNNTANSLSMDEIQHEILSIGNPILCPQFIAYKKRFKSENVPKTMDNSDLSPIVPNSDEPPPNLDTIFAPQPVSYQPPRHPEAAAKEYHATDCAYWGGIVVRCVKFPGEMVLPTAVCPSDCEYFEVRET